MKVKLQVVQGRPQGKDLVLPAGEFVFGRGVECHVRPNSEWVSRQHCLLLVTDDSVRLRDLGSRNGTLVNGARLTGECLLAHGDQVQVGPLVFRVELEATEEFVPPAPDQAAPSAEPPARGNRGADTAEIDFLETMRGLGRPLEDPTNPS